MKKGMLWFFITLAMLLSGNVATPPAIAMELASINGARVNMRSGPGKKFPVLWHLDEGYPLQVLQRKGAWVKVRDFEGDQGWVSRSLTGNAPHMIVKVRLANIRATPSTGGAIVGMAEYGVVFRTIKRDRHWVKVRHEDGLTGWVARPLLWGW